MTTHTMRIPVRAWQVGEDGSLPEEARALVSIATRRGDMWTGWSTGRQERFYAEPGDWIVESAYGLEAMTDAEFRARCEEVRG